ncbi:MAG: DUF1667 domain-containing protein [Clostridia bacterium]|nr:DUF1667 domain-containing protein [Clostridia bacterium]
MKRVRLICVECPLGCDITVLLNEKVVSVEGNSCPRGKVYAESEVICPKRVLTTTVKTIDGRGLPVKTDKPIPKSQMIDLMKKINKIMVNTPIKMGEIIVKNLVDGVNLVATDAR